MREARGSFPFKGLAAIQESMTRTLKELAEFLQCTLLGDGTAEIAGVASLQSAKRGDLVFVEDTKNLPKAFASQATAVIAGEFARLSTSDKPLLLVSQPRLVFARAAEI